MAVGLLEREILLLLDCCHCDQNFVPMNCLTVHMYFVKLQSEVQASALGLGVDFVFPLSQEQEEQQQEQPPPKYTRKKHPRSLKFYT